MKPILLRTADFDLSNDGRNLEGLAFRWDTPSPVADPGSERYLEEFSQRSVDQTLKLKSERPLFVEHDYVRGSVGETSFERSSEGLVFRARTSDTKLAVATLARVVDGELAGVSIGFRPIRSLKRSDVRGPVTVRAEIAIMELSLAKQGMHTDARVLNIRAEDDGATPLLDELRKRRLMMAL